MRPSASQPGSLTRTDLARTWLRAALAGSACLLVLFAGYEIVERAYFRERVSTETLFWMHIGRGMSASVIVGTLSVAVVWWVRSRYEQAFARAYRDLQDAMADRISRSQELEAHVHNQEKMAALGVLSAGIAHDIANPLASMSSELEMLEDETDLGRARASVAELRRQVGRIDRILREMTDFARRRGDEARSLPLHVAIDDALRMVRHNPRARKVHIHVDVARDLPALVAVEDHLVMVFVNLIINAFDAMPDGGALHIESRRDMRGVTISIRDTGVGMTEEVRRKALLPLFTTKHGGRGTGLGLSTSAGVIEAAGGTLTLESAPGQGTEVKLFFPDRESGPTPVHEEASHV